MGTANTKSTVITNADATTPTTNNGYLSRATVFEAAGVVEVAAADDNNSVYRFARVPSNAYVTGLNLSCDAITGGTDYNFGIHQTAANGGAVVTDNLFADAVDLSTALVNSNILFKGTGPDIANGEKRLWELLGLTSDPKREYDVTATGITVGTGAGTILLRVRYAV